MIANHAWLGIAELVAVFAFVVLATWIFAVGHERRRQRCERRAALAPVYQLHPRPSCHAHSRDIARSLRLAQNGRR